MLSQTCSGGYLSHCVLQYAFGFTFSRVCYLRIGLKYTFIIKHASKTIRTLKAHDSCWSVFPLFWWDAHRRRRVKKYFWQGCVHILILKSEGLSSSHECQIQVIRQQHLISAQVILFVPYIGSCMFSDLEPLIWSLCLDNLSTPIILILYFRGERNGRVVEALVGIRLDCWITPELVGWLSWAQFSRSSVIC